MILFLLFAVNLHAQKRILKTDEIRMDGQKLNKVDTGALSDSHEAFPTSAAIKKRLDSLNSAFNGDRNILRVPSVGQNLGTTSINEWLEWWYFTPPTLSMVISPTTTVYEYGDSSQVIATSTTTNSGGATLSVGALITSWSGGSENKSFGASTTARDTIQFAPIAGSSTNYNRQSYSFQSSQGWVFGSESGTANSNTRTVQAVYPVFYGMSSTDFSSSGNIYGVLTKLVTTEGNKSVNLNGSGFIYYAIPTTWSDTDLSSIIDHNGFNVTSSFTVYDITVSSSGLTNDYSGVSYKLYKLNSETTTSNFTYQFNR